MRSFSEKLTFKRISGNPRETSTFLRVRLNQQSLAVTFFAKASGLITSVAFPPPGTGSRGCVSVPTPSYSRHWLQLHIPIQTCLSDQRGGRGGQLSEALEQIVGNSCVLRRPQLVARYCFLIPHQVIGYNSVPLLQTAARKAIEFLPQGSAGFEKSVRKAKMWSVPPPPL